MPDTRLQSRAIDDLLGRLRHSLTDAQTRAGFDLVSSSAFNAIAGLAFWFVAARAFDEAVVGVNAAAITTMGLIDSFATLGMKNALIRFMPGDGLGARAFVLRTYAFAGAATLALAPIVAYSLGDRLELFDAVSSPIGVAAFTFACLLWVAFVLQDSVLVAIGKTPLVPLSNLAYAVAKLAALIALSFMTFRWGIFIAWVAPLAVIVVWVNTVAFRTMQTRDLDTDGTPHGLARFAAGDFASTVLNVGLFGLLPIFVLAELGERASAFYALSFTIAYSLMLANSNLSTALLAAASIRPGELVEQSGKALRQMAMMVIPAGLIVAIVAPLALRVFGSSYADEGSNLLRLLALTAIANIPVAVSIGILRAERRVARLVGLYGFRTLLIGSLCAALGSGIGLTGLGLGWLIGESVMALALFTGLLRPVLAASSRALRGAGR